MPDIRELIRLHLTGMAKFRELLEECRRIHNAGHAARGRRIFRQAESVR